MKRTFNSTGRRRIPQERVSVHLMNGQKNAPPSFSMHLEDLSDLKLSPAARIYVEAHVGYSVMRFAFGTVALPEAPQETALTELDAGSRPLFSVKVVDESGEIGKILAAATDISPKDPGEDDGRKALLPLRQMNLGEELWKVRISHDSGPELIVNSRIPGLADRIKNDPLTQGIVLPAAVGRVLAQLFDPDEDSEWQRDWRAFAETLEGERVDWEVDPQDSGMQIEDLVAELLRRFCDRNRYATLAIERVEGHSHD